MTDVVEGRIVPVLMFEGRAQEAIDLYTAVLPDARVAGVHRYGPQGPGDEGTVLRAVVLIGDRPVVLMDSPVHHEFTFTPSISLSLTCQDRTEIEHLVGELGRDGQVLMPLDSYGFSTAYAWINDRFGVSWQLTLP
ncbi:VOC family protein [Kineococcus esterisolvens]|uniref:VOC family protein n=1 Tax=unclassified Kineococcus TaxID=2621656 RepID=UPI003D7D223C